MCQNCNQNNCGGCTETTTICNQCTSEQTTCDCEIIDFKSDCILYVGDDIECNSVVIVPKNTILTDALALMTSHNCTKFAELANYLRIINVGTGASIYAGDNLIGEKKLRKINSTSPIVTVTENTNDISLGIDSASLDTFIEANQKTYTAANIGTGAQVYKDSTVVGNNTQLNFRKIKSSDSSVSIVEGTNDIDVRVSAGIVPDGSETKVTAGTNVAITGTGTIATPYVINSTDTNTTYLAGTSMSLVGTTFNNTAPDQTVTLTQGGATTITGTYPNFTISSTDTNTTYSAGIGLSLTGTTFSLGNPQFLLTTVGITLSDTYHNGTFIIDNGATAITITIPDTLTTSGFCVGFIQKGTGDVAFVVTGTATLTNPIGYKIKGQGYQTFIERNFNTQEFFLLGNTKSV